MILPLNAGVNLDKHPTYINSDKGEVTGSVNLRPTSSSGGRMGTRTSLKSMLEYSASLPSGTNKWIGYAEDKEREIGIAFNYNSNGNHGIYTYTGGTFNLGIPSNQLNFNASEQIDAAILGDFCTFVSAYNPPRRIKIAVGSVPVFENGLEDETSETIQLARKHPVNAPVCTLGTDETKKVNKLTGKVFQFATYYIYSDYTYSVLSPYSKALVSPAVFAASDNTYIDSTIGNFANITFDVGDDSVRKVVLVAREGNSGSWFKVHELDKNIETGDSSVAFYNDRAREYLPISKALALYSDVPLLANSVAVAANRIVLGGVKKGYSKTKIPFSVEVEYETVAVNGTTTALAVTDGFYGNNAYIEIAMPASVAEGDVVSVTIDGVFDGDNQTNPVQIWFFYAASYTVKAGDVVDDVRNFFYYDITTKGKSIVTHIKPYNYSGYDIVGEQTSGVRIVFVGVYESVVVSQFIYSSSASAIEAPKGVNTYKAGSYYQVGGCLYDDKSRTSGVLSPTRVYIPSNGERPYADRNKRARLKFTMGNYTPPSWATRMRFAVTESINFAGIYPFVTGNNAGGNAYDDIYVDGKKVIAIKLPENFNYQFAKGDYVQLEIDSGSITTIIKTIIGTRTAITVGTEEKVGFWLILPQGGEVVTDYQDLVGYICRPKSQVEDLVYYEDSVTYSSNISGQTGYIGDGDAWFVNRKFQYDNDAGGYSKDYTVEDFFISIDDNLRAYSKGRATAELDKGQVALQDVVWSEPYLDNTEINGMSFFDSTSRKQLDEKDGKIAAIRLVGDVLKVIQKNKETSMYIGKQQITNADGTLSLVNTNNFVGTVYPMNTDYGTSSLRSVEVNGRDMFYWDGERRQVIRSSPNGQFPISDYGIKSRCLELGALTSNGRVISYYDRTNDEFVIIFKAGNRVETWAFKEDMWWQYDFSDSNFNVAEVCGHIGNTTLSLLRGKIYKHEAGTSYNTFFGAVKRLSVKGVVNVYPTQEKCLRSLILSSNKPLDVTITSPSSVTRQYGQKSYLKAETWFERDSKYVSAVFKNIIMNNGLENMTLIHKGNDMVGEYLEIELSETTNEEVRIQSLETNETVNV